MSQVDDMKTGMEALLHPSKMLGERDQVWTQNMVNSRLYSSDKNLTENQSNAVPLRHLSRLNPRSLNYSSQEIFSTPFPSFVALL